MIRAKLGPADFVCYGPYLWLARGHHKATFEFSIERAERGAEIRVEAVTDFGSRILAEGYVEAGRPGRAQCVLGFDIDSGAPSHDTGLLELRVWSPGTIQFGLLSLRVERAPRSERESAQARELLPLLHPGNAGDKKSDDGIAAVPGAAGFVFYGPPLDVDAGGHRLTLGLVRDATAMRPVHGSGLGVEVVSGSRLVGYRPITADELTRGRVSIDFTIPADGPDEKKSRAEFRLLTTGQTDVTVSRVALGRTPLGSRPDLSEFDYLPLLKVGPAGDSDRAGSRKRRLAFRAKRGVAGFVAFGPYVWLPKGRYEVTFELYAVRAERGAAMKVEVAADVGTRILAERSIETHWRGRRFESVLGRRRGTIEAVLAFEMTSDVAPEDGGLLEFRVWSPGTIEFSLVGVRVRKVADLVQVAEEAAVSSP